MVIDCIITLVFCYKGFVATGKERLARKRLGWIEHARLGIISALGDDMVDSQFKAFPTVDPLRFILKIPLHLPIPKDARGPLRTYLRCWADEYKCDVGPIRITKRWIQAEVLTQERTWSRDEKGQFTKKRRERFGGRS